MTRGRRKFLKGAAATAAAATAAPWVARYAHAAEEIRVAELHDLSGFIDIFKMYTIAADYNYGQIISAWGRKFVQEHGGSVLSEDYFPLDVTQFGSVISKIQAAKPDMIWSALVGTAH